jgi:Ca2+-binding RTX toxin-like protein
VVDIPGDSTTTQSINVGGTLSDQLEVVGDHDWIRINLTQGQSISVSLDGITLEDPYLRIRDASGNIIYENDDISPGSNRDSLLAFTANYTGVYYIDVGAWNEGYTGTYTVSVNTYTPPPVGTNDQLADQLINGYWNGNDRHFNVSPGGTITVNLTALTAAGANLAREALNLWSDVIGVTFSEVTSGGQITFDDNQEGAFSNSITSNGIISSSSVNVSTDWLNTYGTGLTSYAFQAYIHEIGHALGLGHAGNYNDTARYPFDASYQNDSWAVSIMSYFDQQENTYFAGQGFTVERVVTPMVADVLAMSLIYGLSPTTRTGDTTYGFNSNADRAIYDANQYPNVAYTIYDSGGIDTLDYSGFSVNQVINLNPEVYGSFGLNPAPLFTPNVGNLVIARGVTIENAIGGSGADTITGNSVDNILRGNAGTDTLVGNGGNDTLIGGANNDLMTGGAGADTFSDTTGNLSGDTITDFAAGDRIVFTNASLGTFTFSLNATTLTFTGGSLTLQGGVGGTLVASAAAGGGVQLALQAVINDVRNDFNGDGRSDILWRHTDGTIGDWLANANATFTSNGGSVTNVPAYWTVAGTGDFNGDGRDDILWRGGGGEVGDWLAGINGDFAYNAAAGVTSIPNSWQVEGVGDFNADGRDDILWRHTDGTVGTWSGTVSGGFVANNAAVFSVTNDWHIVGTGDFNGDGKDDILWRHDSGTIADWLANASGGFSPNNASLVGIGTDWQIIGTGDFNNDGRDDILWRNSAGTVADWTANADGTFSPNFASLVTITTDWHVAAIGDYNGDGRDDILWRHDSGTVADWTANANGSFSPNNLSFVGIPTDWHVQSADTLWV